MSRYSLNDQFAATRQEFEFGFDDGASTFERSTMISTVMDEQEQSAERTAVPGPITDIHDPAQQGAGRVIDPYDLLVLPPNPSPRDIRRAYFRLFVLLYPDTQPPKLREAASVYFGMVQYAFEQLIGHDKRILQGLDDSSTYDLALDEPGRYQVYQLWRISLARLAGGSHDIESKDDNQQQLKNSSNLDQWYGYMMQKWRGWTKHGYLGLGIKLDMGSPYQFETWLMGFSRFSVLNRQFLSLVPIRTAPRVELSYRGLESSHQQSVPGSWTISAAAEPQSVGLSLKHGIDMADMRWPSLQPSETAKDRTSQHDRSGSGGLRIETEVSCGWLWSKFLALRCLKRVGRFSKCGLEFGFSNHFIHLSFYWSRLGQRIRLPFMVSTASPLSSRFFFWTTFLPLAGLAGWEYVSYRRSCQTAKLEQREDEPGLVQERRAEADDLTIILSTNVESKQEAERAKRGLVILSAKYGVKKDESWGLEEVADVTYALAALVDDSQLWIPGNVNKNNILGFWDPVPGTPKTLHIRYLFRGKELTTEVAQRDELLLPLTSS